MSGEVRRHDFDRGANGFMYHAPDGDYVAWDDYADLLARYEAAMSTIHDEIAANLAFREAGGAHPDEDMPTFCARLLAERNKVAP